MALTLETLKKHKEELEKEIERLQDELNLTEEMIAGREGRPTEINEASLPKITAKSYSVTGRVVDATIELIHKVKKQVGNKEILDYLEEKGVSLGDTKNKQAMLAAILSQEVRKKSARLKKVTRGVYDIKQ